MSKEIQRCTRCVMDNSSDPTIYFDGNGRCNYCSDALEQKPQVYFPNGAEKLHSLVETLKREGQGKPYDCLMGISGGLDSSYLAYLGAVEWGLRIAAVHVDDGYDTEISKQNLKNLIEKTGITLITISPDKQQFNALTKAYMKAAVPNLAVPQDNILFACLYDFARKHDITYFLSGSNFALECILQKGNTHSAFDLANLKDIHRRFGEEPIDKLTFTSSWKIWIEQAVLGMQTLTPLNLLNYNRNKAFKKLYETCGFEYYGRKHLENYLTAFIQLYWFPKKFGVDKRTSHLSSMIVSDQMTREEALHELENPLYDEAYISKVKKLICNNLALSMDELEKLVLSEPRDHEEYKTDRFRQACARVLHKLG